MSDHFSYKLGREVEDIYRCSGCGHVETKTETGNCTQCASPLRLALDQWGFGEDVNLDILQEAAQSLPIHRVLVRYLQIQEVRFFLDEQEMKPEMILQPESILPVISLDALWLWQDLERTFDQSPSEDDSLGIVFKKNTEGFFPFSSYLPKLDSNITSTLRLLTMTLAMRRVFGLQHKKRIQLMPFIRRWQSIDWQASILPSVPLPNDYDPTFYLNEFSDDRKPSNQAEQRNKAHNIEHETPIGTPFASQSKANQASTTQGTHIREG